MSVTDLLGPPTSRPCVRCGWRADHWHHKLTRSRGGLDDAFNCVPVCSNCHTIIHSQPDRDYLVEGSMLDGLYVGPDLEYRHYYGDGRREVVA